MYIIIHRGLNIYSVSFEKKKLRNCRYQQAVKCQQNNWSEISHTLDSFRWKSCNRTSCYRRARFRTVFFLSHSPRKNRRWLWICCTELLNLKKVITTRLSLPNSKKRGSHDSFSRYKQLKLIIKGVLIGYLIALVTSHFKKITKTCSSMIRPLFDSIFVRSTDTDL